MPSEEIRFRGMKSQLSPSEPIAVNSKPAQNVLQQPSNNTAVEILLMLSFALYFTAGCLAIHSAQFIGCPLYLISKDYYYWYQSKTKEFFGIFITTVTRWFSPTTIRISSETEIADQFSLSSNSRLQCNFPRRLVMMANHQIYTDWLYLWWISYCNNLHGHIFIILKESLKYIPVIGPGMRFYSFIFLARKWEKDKARIQHRIDKLNTRHHGLQADKDQMDPMWLLMFPEGTNLSENGRRASTAWAAKSGLEDMRYQLLPRSTGLRFCLQGLSKTVEWVYDCTIAYEGVPQGTYGQDFFTLRSLYFQGRKLPSVNMYWRRFKISSIPLEDSTEFEFWLRERWIEKDKLLEMYESTGRFPPFPKSKASNQEYIETTAKLRYRLQFLVIFMPVTAVFVIWYLLRGRYKV